jgi:hypothetical protein
VGTLGPDEEGRGRVAFATLALFLALAWGWLQIGPSVFVLLVPLTVGTFLAIH